MIAIIGILTSMLLACLSKSPSESSV
ncbi:MAG: hypothetical protein MK132_07530 [Lentisphaerales bacterium]|nr:hypothetical protein [Lentisphaerales bacterium]